MKSFQPKSATRSDPPDDPGNPTVDLHGEKSSNETHASTTDPEAKLVRKGGKEAKLAFMGHALIKNRNGLLVAPVVTAASGRAEREATLGMLKSLRGKQKRTLGADKGYDTRNFVVSCRNLNITPHVAARSSALRLPSQLTTSFASPSSSPPDPRRNPAARRSACAYALIQCAPVIAGFSGAY